MTRHRLRSTYADWSAWVHARTRADVFVFCFSALAVSTVVVKSATLPAPIDHWEYASWYVEDYLLRNDFRTPDCQTTLAVGNYATHWPKICTRIEAPGLTYATVGLTELTGFDFTGQWQRYFLVTPAAKFLTGYLLASLYTDHPRYRTLAATAIFLVPDYTPFYVTQAKGLSYVLLPFGVYARIRWHKGGGPWLAVSVLSFAVLLLFYYPRSLVLFTFYGILGLKELHGGRSVRSFFYELSVNGLLFLGLQFDETIRKLSLLNPDKYAMLLDPAALRLLFASSGGGDIPFLYHSDSTSAAVVLVPVAMVAGLSGLSMLRRQRFILLGDERLLWLYSLVLIYGPAALAVGFFRTRIIFEAAIPGLLVMVGELDEIRGRIVSVVEPLLVTILAGMIIGNLLLLAPAVSYSAEYQGLSGKLNQHGIDEETAVYTDLRTGAYLVGEEQYKHVYRIVDDHDRAAMVAVWYGTDATKACEYMRATGSTHFVLNPTVRDNILFVENYARQPIDRIAYDKFDESPLFDRVTTHNSFRIYSIDADCTA